MAKFSLKDLLYVQKNETDAIAAPEPERFEVRDIPIDKIKPSPKNEYLKTNIEELAASIEQLGLMHNLVVRELPGGAYEIISGERRYRACRLLYESGNADYATIPCKVDASVALIDELKLFHANATARVLTDYEKTVQAERIRAILRELKDSGYPLKGRIREIVAGMLDVSPAQVGRMESIAKNLSDDFKRELEHENIGITDAYELSTMPGGEQAAAHERYKETGALDKPEPRARAVKAIEPAPAPPDNTAEIMALTNHDKRVAFLGTWETWPVWGKSEPLGLTVYKYDMPDGSRISAAHYGHLRAYHGYKSVRYNWLNAGSGFSPLTYTENQIADSIKDARAKIAAREADAKKTKEE